MNKTRYPMIDFIGIGAPKCGTTWLGKCLAQHPEIGFASDKEVYYFSDSVARRYFNAPFNHYAKGPGWYHAQFPKSPPTARVYGEYSPDYMFAPESCARIHANYATVKLIVSLRNPADMLYSLYWYCRNGLIGTLPDTFEGFLKIPFFKQLGCYVTFLTPFFETFPHDHIHVILYDDIATQPDVLIADLYRFLGVNPSFQPERMGQRVNMAHETRFQSLQRFGTWTYEHLRRWPPLATLVTSRTFERVVLSLYQRINRVTTSYVPMAPETHEQLTVFYQPFRPRSWDRPLGSHQTSTK